MADSDIVPGPEASAQGSGDNDRIDALLQRLVDLVQDLNRRAESRQSQTLRQLFARWEQEAARREELGYDRQMEEYERRMRESDARIDENMRDIRRRLDALERRRDKKREAGEPRPER